MVLEFKYPFEGNLSAIRAERERIMDGFTNVRQCIFFSTEEKDTFIKGYFDILIV